MGGETFYDVVRHTSWSTPQPPRFIKCSKEEPKMSEKKGLLAEFKDFITTGDLISIAVAFIMAVALKDLITSFIENIISGILALFLPADKTDLSAWTFADGKIKIGSFVTSIIAFVVLSFVVFMLIKLYKKSTGRKLAQDGPNDNALLTEIRDLLKGQQK